MKFALCYSACVNAGKYVCEPGSAPIGRPPLDHLGESAIYWRFRLNSQESLLVQEISPHPGGRLLASLSQLAQLWRVPAKVWDSVTETAAGQLHSQTMVSVFVLSVCSQQLLGLPVTRVKLRTTVCGCSCPILLNTPLILQCVFLYLSLPFWMPCPSVALSVSGEFRLRLVPVDRMLFCRDRGRQWEDC